MRGPYDPDDQQQRIDAITPEEFGRLVARVVRDEPRSQNWALVQKAVERETGWDAEHEQVRGLVERLAEACP